MQIGVGLSLPLLATRRSGGFSPLSLFTGGTVGAWYDPSDYSTLFQDSAGTTPVTAVEQPVRLMLDKSQGLVLGSELNANGASPFTATTGWSSANAATVSISGGYLVGTASTGVNEGVQYNVTGLTVGAWYKVRVVARASNNNGRLVAWVPFTVPTTTITNSFATYEFLLQATATSGFCRFYAALAGSAGDTITVSEFSVKLLSGNHALAPNDASRPVLRARYNLLTYSEQFDNAVWTTTSATVSANTTATTDPLGGNTADSLIASAASSQHRIYQAVTSSDYTLSVYAKAGTASFISLSRSNNVAYATFNLSTGVVSASAGCTATIQSAGNGWWRCAIASTVATSYLQIAIGVTAANAEPNAVWLGAGENVYVWGAQAVTGSSAGTYQRIAAATVYDTTGFLPYLYFVTDDSFGTNSIDFSATDKMSVCAGVTKLSDAAAGTLIELTADATANNGGFALRAPDSATSDYGAITRGTVASNTRLATTYAAPITNVLTTLLNNGGALSADQITVRINAATPTLSAGTATTAGNFANAAMYIGRRNNATVPFNGRIYQLIVCGKTLSASELASTEAYVATKTGVTL